MTVQPETVLWSVLWSVPSLLVTALVGLAGLMVLRHSRTAGLCLLGVVVLRGVQIALNLAWPVVIDGMAHWMSVNGYSTTPFVLYEVFNDLTATVLATGTLALFVAAVLVDRPPQNPSRATA